MGRAWVGDGGRRAGEAQAGQDGAPGEEPPESNEEQPHAGDDGFLFPHRAAVGVAEDLAPLGKALPARLPAQQPPDGLGKQAAQPPRRWPGPVLCSLGAHPM